MFFVIFSAVAQNFEVKFYMFIICAYLHKSAERHFIFFVTTTKLLDFSYDYTAISHVHILPSPFPPLPLQLHVCRTKDASRLRCRNKHCHLNNTINSLPRTACENSKCLPPAFTHAFDLLVKFLTASLLMASCLRSPAVPA